jgi:hypothetical protein
MPTLHPARIKMLRRASMFLKLIGQIYQYYFVTTTRRVAQLPLRVKSEHLTRDGHTR